MSQNVPRYSDLLAHSYSQRHMTQRKSTPAEIASQIRRALKDGGSAEHAAGVQWFFKEEIKSHGWYTAELRRTARRIRREIRGEHGLDFLVAVADQLFSGPVLEDKNMAVFLLEKLDSEFGDKEFRLFESWLDRISNWADLDALVHYLIAPMVASKPARVMSVFRWAKSRDRWHRRAACVALIRGTDSGSSCLRLRSYPIRFSAIRTTWFRRAWDGCYGRRRRRMRNARSHI